MTYYTKIRLHTLLEICRWEMIKKNWDQREEKGSWIILSPTQALVGEIVRVRFNWDIREQGA